MKACTYTKFVVETAACFKMQQGDNLSGLAHSDCCFQTLCVNKFGEALLPFSETLEENVGFRRREARSQFFNGQRNVSKQVDWLIRWCTMKIRRTF